MFGCLPGENRHQRPNPKVAKGNGGKELSPIGQAAFLRSRRAYIRPPGGISRRRKDVRAGVGLHAALFPVQPISQPLGAGSRTAGDGEADLSRVVCREQGERGCRTVAESRSFPVFALTFRQNEWSIRRFRSSEDRMST